MKKLEGQVTLVTGATRGIGKGIAIALGEAGAIVYITGRSLNNSNSSDDISGSLLDTKLAVEKAGGICIPVQVDHSDDEQVNMLFQRIETEQDGKLDLLVNNAYSGVKVLTEAQGKPFWECEPSLWDACNNVGLRSHYIASMFAARMMTQRRQGLICTISSWGGLSHIFGVAYGTGKSACDRLASDMAVELKPYNVASMAIYPGIVGTEQFNSMADEGENSLFRDRFNWETPLLTGRVIAQLKSEADVMHRTGKVQIVAELARKYGIVGEDGEQPASLRSLQFLLPSAFAKLRNYASFIPDIKVPWWLLLVSTLSSPKI
ncbi:SDR family NAD(P)-dependent oxidoreductase [Brunnivagina elsteri]|uniref:Short-chain dehydrogenase n=1 Tax=Brunnivagina elsteri CCALA 953 TaxID=987040 RepID=A0A2A2TJ74_9CYAN|nr:SDR family NAD(P)-dependent oxidoreductase [Calothrix elsteri]PAX54603.1 short-chain dehydrogenase [Calothrix elsteri CCALA 953]